MIVRAKALEKQEGREAPSGPVISSFEPLDECCESKRHEAVTHDIEPRRFVDRVGVECEQSTCESGGGPGGGGTATVMTSGSGVTLGAATKPEGVTISRFNSGPSAGTSMLIVGDTGGNRIEGRPAAGGAWQLIGTPNNIGSFVGMFRSPSKIR